MNEQIYGIFLEKARVATGGDSSLRVERADELMQSIAYVLSMAPQGLTDGSLIRQFAEGEREVFRKVGLALELHGRAVSELLPLHIAPYLGVPDSIAPFFKLYRYDLYAHSVPCMVDYRLALPVEDERGVSYIFEYLKRFLIENAYLARREPYIIEEIVAKEHPAWRESVLNIFETVLAHDVMRRMRAEDEDAGEALNSLIEPGTIRDYAARVLSGMTQNLAIRLKADGCS